MPMSKEMQGTIKPSQMCIQWVQNELQSNHTDFKRVIIGRRASNHTFHGIMTMNNATKFH